MTRRLHLFFLALAICSLALAVFTSAAAAGTLSPLSITKIKITVKNDTNNGSSSDACYNQKIDSMTIVPSSGGSGRSFESLTASRTFSNITPGTSRSSMFSLTPSSTVKVNYRIMGKTHFQQLGSFSSQTTLGVKSTCEVEKY